MSKVLPTSKAVTREVLLARAGFNPLEAVRASLTQVQDALTAVAPSKLTTTLAPDGTTVKHEEGGAPDWPVRLRAAEQMFGLADVQPKSGGLNATLTGPVSITWVTPTPSPSSPPKLTSGLSTNDSSDSRSSSATEDSAKPSWL